ncbi:MAG: fibronectin type III domain-containing protein [Betaproteobacteria bacterium]|nr:fibronectin type III domain-containing protein [Betaproteobacteria bacterium]
MTKPTVYSIPFASSGQISWIVAQHGYEGNSNLTLLVRKDVMNPKFPWSTSHQKSYDQCYMDRWFNLNPANITGKGVYDDKPLLELGKIPLVTIKTRTSDSVKSTLQRRVFALSHRELGHTTHSDDSTPIPYFNSNARRQAGGLYWTRNPMDSTTLSFNWRLRATAVKTDGSFGADEQTNTLWEYIGNPMHCRPAFCLPSDITVDDVNGWILGNQPPGAPGSVTVPKNHTALGNNQVLADAPFAVNWTHASDPDHTANQLSYTIQRNYDEEKLLGILRWTTIASGVTGTSYTINSGIPKNSAKTARYRVIASDPYVQSSQSATSALIDVVSNSAPTTPPSITVVSPTFEKGDAVTVTWGASTDPDNNLSGYILERSTDGGTTWTRIPNSSATFAINSRTWSGTLNTSWTQVRFRVKAFDAFAFESAYRTSTNYTLKDPVKITVAQASSSTIKNGSTYTTDAARTVIFSVANSADTNMTAKYTTKLTRNGALVESKNAVITGGLYTLSLTKLQWQCLLNGSHTYTLSVTDAAGNSGQAGIAFAKNISKAIIKSEPFEVQLNNGIIKNFLMNVAGKFPAGSILAVQITNNAKDPSPVWQDVTPSQLDGGYHPVNNTTVAKGNWFAVRVTLQRGTATDPRWISQISGMAGLSQTFILAEDNKQLREDLDTLANSVEANRLAAFKYKGSVAAFANLPPNPNLNDVWETTNTGDEWYWSGSAWKPFGPTIVADAVPTANSTNLITSGGVEAAFAALVERIETLEQLLADAAEAMIGGNGNA